MYGLLWLGNICKSGIWGCKKNRNIEKIFKVVQMKSLVMHIMQGFIYLQNIFMEHDLNILMIFVIKENDNFELYNALLAIATNIPVLLMTAFVSHIF